MDRSYTKKIRKLHNSGISCCGYMDWIGLAQDRDRWQTLVSVVMNLHIS